MSVLSSGCPPAGIPSLSCLCCGRRRGLVFGMISGISSVRSMTIGCGWLISRMLHSLPPRPGVAVGALRLGHLRRSRHGSGTKPQNTLRQKKKTKQPTSPGLRPRLRYQCQTRTDLGTTAHKINSPKDLNPSNNLEPHPSPGSYC